MACTALLSRVLTRGLVRTLDSLPHWKVDYMRNIRFWIPAIIGALVPPICLYLTPMGADHAGAGLGALLLFYPVPLFIMMLLAGGPSGDAFLSQIIGALAFGGAILQFPLYGFIISYAKLKQSFWLKLCAGVIWLHIIAIAVFLVIALIHKLL